MAVDTSSIVLGSGYLYIAKLVDNEIPTDIISDENCVGDISGGAELSYTPTIKEVKNDFDETRKAFITSEEVKLKSGILTWNLSNMEKVTVGATYNEASKKLTIGGKKSIEQYAVAFVHPLNDTTNLVLTMRGYNGSGWTFKFDSENPSTTDAEFIATKDSKKTLITVEEKTAE